MIFSDEGFEWRFEVEWKDRRDEDLSQKILEVVSNVDRDKWEKSNETEDTLLVCKEEVSKLFWVASS